MEQFGLVREGTEWVIPASKLLRVLLLLGAAIMLGLCSVGLAQTGLSESVWLLALFGGVGLLFLLTAIRMRQSIDPQRRAFVWRGPFGHTVLPFQDIHALRLIHLTTNGAYQGMHVQAFTHTHPTERGRMVSPSFATEAEAQAYEQALHQLMTANG